MLASRRILLVDDSEPFRHLVALMLQEDPGLYSVVEATDGLEGVQKAKNLKPDLILLDIGLPKLNGIDASRLIREYSPNSKIIFLTGETDPYVVKAALDTGALGYVHKPFAGIELGIAAEAALQGRQFVSRSLKLSSLDVGLLKSCSAGFTF